MSLIADGRWILCFNYRCVLALKTLSLFNVYAETSCKNGIIYNSTCYKIHRELANWFTAVNRCLSNNGSLAVFDDNITTYFAFNTFLPRGALWIGLIKSWWTWPDAGLYSLQWHQQVCVVFVWLAAIIVELTVVKQNNFWVGFLIHEVHDSNGFPLYIRCYRGPCLANGYSLINEPSVVRVHLLSPVNCCTFGCRIFSVEVRWPETRWRANFTTLRQAYVALRRKVCHIIVSLCRPPQHGCVSIIIVIAPTTSKAP